MNVLGYFQANPQASSRSAEKELCTAHSFLHNILKNHNMHPYKFTKVQALKPEDFNRKVRFCENITIRIQEESNFLPNIIWTDEV